MPINFGTSSLNILSTRSSSFLSNALNFVKSYFTKQKQNLKISTFVCQNRPYSLKVLAFGPILESLQWEYYVRVGFFRRQDVISIKNSIQNFDFKRRKKRSPTLINSLRFESLPKTLGILSFSSLMINAWTLRE